MRFSKRDCRKTQNGFSDSPIHIIVLSDIDLPVPPIKLSVLLSDLADDPARVADGDGVCRDVLCYDASGADDRVIADRYAGEDNGACAYPAVFADFNCDVVLKALFAERRVDGMSGGCDGHVRSEHCAVSDEDLRVVNGGEIEVAVDVVAEMYVSATPVCVKRGLDITAFTDFRKHFLKERLPLFSLGGAGGIIVVLKLKALFLLLHDSFVVRKIKLSGEHFFKYVHVNSFRMYQYIVIITSGRRKVNRRIIF